MNIYMQTLLYSYIHIHIHVYIYMHRWICALCKQLRIPNNSSGPSVELTLHLTRTLILNININIIYLNIFKIYILNIIYYIILNSFSNKSFVHFVNQYTNKYKLYKKLKNKS